MKNFITVGTRIAGAALFACAAAGPVQAATCEFRPNAPDQHLVVRGDTLWDISGKFLEHPWCWPQVWGMNRDEIRNPHWIYPGQIVYFDRKTGRLTLNKPGSDDADGIAGTTRLSPQIRTEGLGVDAVQSIPSGVIEPFLSMPLIVETNELEAAPRIAAAEEGHVYIGKDDKVYVRGALNGGTSFQVFRPGNALRDPDTGRLLAYEAVYLGTAKLRTEAKPGVDVHTFTVSSSKQEMGVGDRLLPAPPTPIRNYVPHPPERPVAARVLSSYSGVTYAGQNQVVSINRGSLDGLDVGAVLQLYHFGKTIADPGGSKGLFGLGKTMIKLPDEQVGTLFIFRVFKHVSYGLIMQTTQPVEVGDVAKSPE
ncbi:LysM peptidoglycan-binding domain-containing protein [Massilia sp. R2A-15]|uniref:LysM peptidoglycan-binding domain-containing protein n=1 Tax=Massilia sp. R2A-15 TaxID=3064278 RepID=UPI00273752B8|nr:LysM peptidoglycan-binding domain-containing protein [Massilia sp. R2A-15]WLI89717.1 LysM peptidoglycan-binding domain-containing protein [Massilia sp. R2A-15]